MRNKKWPSVQLGNHVDLLCGYAFKSKGFTDDPNDIPLVKGANVHQGYIDWADSKYWPRNDPADYTRYFLETNDVVLAMDRPWIEAGLKYSWIRKHHPKALLVQRVARMRGINGLESSYLRFIIGSNIFTDYIKPIVTGINVPHISADQIKAFHFSLPPASTQRKIAGILSAYDDLIENNTRRIAILEEMAQSIYREWFVNFRFPGYEKVKLVDSPLGKIPKAWSTACLENVMQYINRGISPKYNENSSSLVINQKCIRGGSVDLAKARKHKTSFPTEKTIRFGDILVNSTGRGTLGRVAQIYSNFDDVTVDSHVTIVRQIHAASIDYLGIAVGLLQDYFDRQGVGSTGQTELSRGVIGKTQIVLPDSALQEMFSKQVRPIRMNIEVLKQKNKCLSNTRDLLLPKLINGQLDVEGLDIDVGDTLQGATG